MQRLFFLLLLLLTFACGPDKSLSDNIKVSAEQETRIWHQTDTIYAVSEWTSDSLRQIKLDIPKVAGFHLEAQSNAPIYLFFGDRLLQKSQNGYLKYSFDNLPLENVFLSLDQEVQEMSYGIYFDEEVTNAKPYPSLEKTERDNIWLSDNIMIIILIGASLFMAIIKINYDKRYLHILSFTKVFTTRLNELDQSRVRIMDQDNLVFAGFYAFLTSGLIYFLSLSQEIPFLSVGANSIIEFLRTLLIVAIALIAKVILVSIASNLFGNNKIAAFYVKEMLNINLFFGIILFFSSVLIFLFEGAIPSLWISMVTYSVVGFYIVRLILLYFKILKLSSFTNLYLFSYFCTTEIFPFLIGLKYFIR